MEIKVNKENVLKLLLENRENITLIEMGKAIKSLNFKDEEEKLLLRMFKK